jgi:hypothetical protein
MLHPHATGGVILIFYFSVTLMRCFGWRKVEDGVIKEMDQKAAGWRRSSQSPFHA